MCLVGSNGSGGRGPDRDWRPRHEVGLRKAEADLAGMKARLGGELLEADRARGVANLTKGQTDLLGVTRQETRVGSRGTTL